MALRAAVAGDMLIAPRVTARLLRAFSGSGPPPRAPHEPLSPREEEVLRAVSRGLTNQEVGRELHLSLSTVKTHLAALMAKLGARNRVEIVVWAYQTGRVR